jgi:hypothetical protein
MPELNARPTKSGSVIVKEYGVDVGFNREEAIVAIAEGSEVGLVVKDDGDGTWSAVVAADVAGIAGETLAVVIDDYLYDNVAGVTLPADLGVAVLKAAPQGVMIGDANLSFGDALDAAQKALVIAQLEAQGFEVVAQAPKA